MGGVAIALQIDMLLCDRLDVYRLNCLHWIIIQRHLFKDGLKPPIQASGPISNDRLVSSG